MIDRYIPPISKQKFSESYRLPVSKDQQNLQNLFAGTIASMDKIAIGPYMWVISNLADLRVYHSGGMVNELTGLSAEEFTALPGGAQELSANEDIEATFGFIYHSMEYRKQFSLNRRNEIFMSYYFRFRRNGSDKWMVMKTVEESPELEGRPQYLLAMLMDVSHVKKTGPPMMTIFDAHTRESKVFESSVTHTELVKPIPPISKRELEILSYIAKGYSSKMIAATLNISTKTVENHRSNVLLKTDSRSSAEVITYALRNGLL